MRAVTGSPGGGAAGCALPSAAGGPALPQDPCVCRLRMLVGVVRSGVFVVMVMERPMTNDGGRGGGGGI